MGNNNQDVEIVYSNENGLVNFTGQPFNNRDEIEQERNAIIHELETGYRNLQKHMAPYQEEWDDNWVFAVNKALFEGAVDGAVDWGLSNADLLEAETWSEMYDSISNGISKIWDTSRENTPSIFEQMIRVNPVMWVMSIYYINDLTDGEYLKKRVSYVSKEVKEALELAEKLYKYKDEVIELLELVAKGGDDSISKIQEFIDGPLRDIDPEWADEIKNNPNRPYIIEVIADHQTAMAYFSYAGLLYRAVPGNFYIYIAQRGGTYLAVEVLLNLLIGFFSAGAATTGRLALLIARIGTMSAVTLKKVPHVQQAVKGFQQALTVYSEAGTRLLALGEKLNKGRSASFTGKAATSSTLKNKQQTETRNGHCKICGKEGHGTPTQKHGVATKSTSREYRLPLENKVPKTHPVYKGIAMQAHHLIAGDVSKKYKNIIELYDYDINRTTNLSFIPSTWQGACHLGVQPHIGSHDVDVLVDTDGSDYALEKTYVASVDAFVKVTLRSVKKKYCPYKSSHRNELRKKFDKLSEKIASMLSQDPPTLHLTQVSMLFGKDQVGCGGQQEAAFKQGGTSRQAPKEFAKAAKKALSNKDNKFNCKHGRDHFGHGKIEYKKPSAPYKLEPGN